MQLIIDNLPKLGIATLETLYMVLVAGAIAIVLGLPLGVVANITRQQSIAPNRAISIVADTVINIGRSIPFVILLIWIIPMTRAIVGTAIGTTAAIVPLAVACIPFFARVVDGALKDVDIGVVECAKSMGIGNFAIVTKVMIVEAMPAIVRGISLTLVSLIGYSAMAGTIGGGGLGDFAKQEGFVKYQATLILVAVIILVLMVQFIQILFNKIACVIDHK